MWTGKRSRIECEGMTGMNIMRISGLASGMDTESIVESLMRVERMRLDSLNQTKQIALWRQEQYNEINKELANFIIQTRKELELTRTTSYGTTFRTAFPIWAG